MIRRNPSSSLRNRLASLPSPFFGDDDFTKLKNKQYALYDMLQKAKVKYQDECAEMVSQFFTSALLNEASELYLQSHGVEANIAEIIRQDLYGAVDNSVNEAIKDIINDFGKGTLHKH